MARPVPPQLRNLPPVVGPLNGPQLLAVGVGTTVVTGVATDPGGDPFTARLVKHEGKRLTKFEMIFWFERKRCCLTHCLNHFIFRFIFADFHIGF